MATIKLTGQVDISNVRREIVRVSSVAAPIEELELRIADFCFLETGTIAHLTSWLLSEGLTGSRLRLFGNASTIGYLARMNFHRVFDLEEPDHGRRPQGGRFIPILLVRESGEVFDAVNAIIDVVLQQFDRSRDFVPAFEWAVNEIMDNVLIHARSPRGGVVCAQGFPNRHRLDIAICDSGIGIKRSLSESFDLKSDREAIEKALERGVTRNTQVGQGNGMAGSLEILRRNGGSIRVWSGSAMFRMIDGKDAGFVSGPDLPGTGVVLSFDPRRPVELKGTWIGEPGWSYLDAEADRIADHGIVIRDACSHTGSRPPATRLRRKILALLPEVDGAIKLDFTGVTSVSSSFLDELLGRLSAELGTDRFNERIIASGLTELQLNMANNVIGQRMALDEIETPDGGAWVLKISPRSDPLSGYVVTLNGELELYAGIRESDWFLLIDESGMTTGVGRILRVRNSLAETSFYFDRAQALEQAPVSGFDISMPATGPVARLPWSTFLSVLHAVAGHSPENVPLIDDVIYARELMQLAVMDDLLGPAGGPQELLKDVSVRDRYLVGKLAPRRPDRDTAAQVEPAAAADEAGDLEDEDKAPLHEPGSEFASVSGRIEPEDDTLDEIDTTSNQSLVPSSMGMTFCVAPDVDTLTVEARWGRYERVPNDEHDIVKTRKNRETGIEEEIKVSKVWQRIPCGGAVSLPLSDGPIRPIVPDDENPDIGLQGTVRTNDKGERLVSLFLVNSQWEPDENKDRAWLFQPEIVVTASYGSAAKAVFRRRPRNEITVDDPEQDRLGLIYRNRLEFAVGHGVSVHAKRAPEDPTRAVRVRTEVMPNHEVPVTETPGLDPEDRPAMRRMVDKGWLNMRNLAEMEPAALREALTCLVEDYGAWIDEQRARVGKEIVGFDQPGQDVVKRCEEVHRRLWDGLNVLLVENEALQAFRFANHAMALQRVRSIYALRRRRKEAVDVATLDVPENRSWRPFQLAFLLLSIPSLADPRHPDRTKPADAFADLLWFPTGGGKTEAYLGVAAFAMAMRRLKNDLGSLDASRGLAVIMRYTLRLLTLQQFQRATTLLCAMEIIRRADNGTWGAEPFTLGLWVGNRVTPGTTEESHEAIRDIRKDDRSPSGVPSPAQLTSCPWCGSDISAGRDIDVDKIAGRTMIYCGDKPGICDFARAKSKNQPHPGLPVKVVDEEIYHRPPTMMIATVDKFAAMALRVEVRNLFGRVSQECERHGLLWPGHDCGTGHRTRDPYPAAKVKSTPAIRPPDLIIQDEFHLISGPLGTMVGLYEAAIDELSSWRLDDLVIRPKVVASTATVRRADDQIRNVFMRRVSVFPPSGLDVEDNFFAVQRPTIKKPGRRYLGICAPGTSRPAVLIRTYTAFLTAAQALFDRFGPVADPYMTLVGYFNSLRELGGMKRLAEDDVQTRSFRVNMSLIERPSLAQRKLHDVRELTSRISSQEIPKHLDQLEIPFEGSFDSSQGKWIVKAELGNRPVDIVLATNMLSVGVDVNRLGLMVVNGQPKGTAEYIQATSRVGRACPGLVATVLTWARPRDLSHYETFEHYHAAFYQHVEAQSVTPFSPRAMDRGLTGAMLSIMRNKFEPFAPNDGAGAMNSPDRSEMTETIGAVEMRAWKVTKDPDKRALTEAELTSRADQWAKEASGGGRTLVYRKHGASPTAYPLIETPGTKPWTDWTVPTSMREVESGVRLIMEDERSTSDPPWRAQTNLNEESSS